MGTDVLVVRVPHTAGSLQRILEIIAEKDVNIEYMYGLTIEGDDASIVMKTNDNERAAVVLAESGIKTITEDEIAKL